MALGTSLLAIVLSTAGYVSNVAQNQDVLSAMHHAFSTIPGVLWVITAGVLLFYRLDKKKYNRIVNILKYRERNNNVQS
jgi:Na+/melibiose symporter-like transporter